MYAVTINPKRSTSARAKRLLMPNELVSVDISADVHSCAYFERKQCEIGLQVANGPMKFWQALGEKQIPTWREFDREAGYAESLGYRPYMALAHDLRQLAWLPFLGQKYRHGDLVLLPELLPARHYLWGFGN